MPCELRCQGEAAELDWAITAWRACEDHQPCYTGVPAAKHGGRGRHRRIEGECVRVTCADRLDCSTSVAFQVMAGYWRNDAATAASVFERDDGKGNVIRYMRTGDLGWQDDGGYLYLNGRIKDVVNLGDAYIFSCGEVGSD